jgi:hypothetical protein
MEKGKRKKERKKKNGRTDYTNAPRPTKAEAEARSPAAEGRRPVSAASTRACDHRCYPARLNPYR